MAVVEVYFNVRKRVFSVREHGKVIGHTDKILLKDVQFVVREAGRQRVLRTGCKNVHAWARGEALSWYNQDTGQGLNPLNIWKNKDELLRQVTYNPRKYTSFVLAEDRSFRVDHADRVILLSDPSTIDPIPPETWAWREKGWRHE